MKAMKSWRRGEGGLAAAEFALVFPVLMTLLVGVYDFGTAFVINQKAITASQMMADLISRNVVVTDDQLADIIRAGEETMRPFSIETYGYDIISLSFVGTDEDDVEAEVCWRASDNMVETDIPIDNAMPLAMPGEGLVIVSVGYFYTPVFAGRLFEGLPMREVAFARGRRSAVVSFQVDADIGCEDDE